MKYRILDYTGLVLTTRTTKLELLFNSAWWDASELLNTEVIETWYENEQECKDRLKKLEKEFSKCSGIEPTVIEIGEFK